MPRSLLRGTFFEGFENGAFDGTIGGAIGGAITGGLTFAIGPSSTIWGSIARSAGIEAGSTGTSNMCVTMIDYLAENPWAYHKYKVLQDIDGVTLLEIAAAFDQPGGGIQFELPLSVKALIEKGYLKEIFF